jgi:hypothetical protein
MEIIRILETAMPNADENRATWKDVEEWIAEYPDRENWNRWRTIIKPLVERAIASQFDSLFRAGQSMSHLVLSTLDHHGLRYEPRVTVEVTHDWKLRISWSTHNIWFRSPSQFEIVEPRMAFPVFTRYLQHLWKETSPEPIPEILRDGHNYEPEI